MPKQPPRDSGVVLTAYGGSGEVAEQLGELADLGGADHAGDGTTRKADFQGISIGRGKLGEDEGGADL